MSAWITLDCEIGGHPKMALLPSDTARYGWVLALTEAKKQRRPGTFASERHFRAVMGRHGRFVADYLRAKLLDRASDGGLAVHDWQRHQWAAAKAGQRETIEGQREDIPETSQGPDVDASRAVSVPVPVGSSEGGPGETDGLTEVVAWLAARKVAVRSGSRPETDLAILVDQYDASTVIRTMAALPGDLKDSAQFVYGAKNSLNPIPSSPRHASSKGYQPDMAAAVAAFNRPLRYVKTEDPA